MFSKIPESVIICFDFEYVPNLIALLRRERFKKDFFRIYLDVS